MARSLILEVASVKRNSRRGRKVTCFRVRRHDFSTRAIPQKTGDHGWSCGALAGQKPKLARHLGNPSMDSPTGSSIRLIEIIIGARRPRFCALEKPHRISGRPEARWNSHERMLPSHTAFYLRWNPGLVPKDAIIAPALRSSTTILNCFSLILNDLTPHRPNRSLAACILVSGWKPHLQPQALRQLNIPLDC